MKVTRSSDRKEWLFRTTLHPRAADQMSENSERQRNFTKLHRGRFCAPRVCSIM